MGVSARNVFDRIVAAARPEPSVGASLPLAHRAFYARSDAARTLPFEGAAATMLVDAASALFGSLGLVEGPEAARELVEGRLDEACATMATESPRSLAARLQTIVPPEGVGRSTVWLVACVCAVVARHEDQAEGVGAADEAWLLARARGESIEHPDPEHAAGYARLEDAIRSLPGREPPPGWREKVLAQIPPDTWWRRLWRRLSRRVRKAVRW
jgi:hypothetical protein